VTHAGDAPGVPASLTASAASGRSRTAWHARWVLPVASAPLEHGAVVVEGDRIAWVGPSTEAEAERHERLGEAVLLPGLVNAHTHLELTGLRGFLEGLDFRDWLRVLTIVRRDVLSEDDLLDASRLGVAEALCAGITTLADCSASGVPLRAMREAGVRGRVYLETFGPDPRQVDDSMRALREGVARLREHATELVHVGVSPHAPYTVSPALFAAVAQYARTESLHVATHVAESAAETAFVRDGAGPFADRLRARDIVVQGTGASPVTLLERTGLLATQPLLIHAIQVDADDIARIADRGATVVHCPISNAKLGQGIAPVCAMRDAGLAVGLGSDSVASNDAMDLVQEARQAVLLQSLHRGAPDALSATTVLEMATRDGARALGLPGVGELVAGARADLCAFRIDALEAAPVYDPAVVLVHVIGAGRRAALTMAAGQVLVRDGRPLHEDTAVRSRVIAAAERVRRWAAVNA
jgi:5-methylthioadenosine/S-adenosylhomocysteine deaminase